MKSKNILFLTTILVAILLMSGCINQKPNIKDCGTDDLCFADNIETCQPAKVTFTISDDLGSEVKYEEIYGNEKIGEENLCSVYIKVIDENILLEDEEKVTDLGKKLTEITEAIENKDMLCKFKVDLTNEETMMDIGGLLKNLDPTTKTFVDGCNGPLKDEIINRGFEIQQILSDYETTDLPVEEDYTDLE